MDFSGCGRSKTAGLSPRRCFEAIRRQLRGRFRESLAYILALALTICCSEPLEGVMALAVVTLLASPRRSRQNVA